MNDLSLYIHQH